MVKDDNSYNEALSAANHDTIANKPSEKIVSLEFISNQLHVTSDTFFLTIFGLTSSWNMSTWGILIILLAVWDNDSGRSI